MACRHPKWWWRIFSPIVPYVACSHEEPSLVLEVELGSYPPAQPSLKLVECVELPAEVAGESDVFGTDSIGQIDLTAMI